MKFGLREQVVDQIINFARECNLELVILFGSRARGDYRRTSDVDIAVSGGNMREFYFKIEEEVDSLLLFDIVDLHLCDTDISDEIRRDGKILYKKT